MGLVHEIRDASWVDMLPGGPLLLVLDFDGTLVEIAPTPDAIVVPRELRGLLASLKARGHRVVILTGRSTAFIVERLLHPREDVIGLHGLEWPGEAGPARSPCVDDARARVLAALETSGGVPPAFLVEDKGLAVAFHWRRVPVEDQGRVITDVAQALASIEAPDFTVLDGHMMKEFRPARASKATAVARLASHSAHRPVVFVGDDVTDEQGFAALPQNGVAVRVSAAPVETRALVVVRDPVAVRAGLSRLARRDDGAHEA